MLAVNVFVTGSRGFIGRHLAPALAAGGHRVLCGVSPRAAAAADGRFIVVDFTRDVDVATWVPRLDGVDCVINTVGVIGNSPDMVTIHSRVPNALFAAAAQRAIQVVQVSALGADEGAVTAFHRTKRDADDALLEVHPFATVVQPSLVFGEDGVSTGLFMLMASMPVIPLPGNGRQNIQPIHIDDVTAAIVLLVGNRRFAGQKIALVGPVPLTLRGYLQALRTALGLGRAWFLPIPRAIVVRGARIFEAWGQTIVDRDALQMLERSNTADVAPLHALLGRMPRPPSDFITPAQRKSLATEAKMPWLLTLVRISIAIVWFAAGVVSAGVYPRADSLALLERTGVRGVAAMSLLFAGVAVDLALGVASLIAHDRRLWLLQIVVVLGYTAIITLWLPEYWLHPYGPVVKNIPFICALYMLYELERR